MSEKEDLNETLSKMIETHLLTIFFSCFGIIALSLLVMAPILAAFDFFSARDTKEIAKVYFEKKEKDLKKEREKVLSKAAKFNSKILKREATKFRLI